MRILYRRESNSMINRRLSFLIVNLVFFYSFSPIYVHFVSGFWLFLCRVWKNSLDLLDFEENDFRETQAWNS